MPESNTKLTDSLGLFDESEDTPASTDLGQFGKRYGELGKTAGARGFTFAGRVVKDPREAPEQVLKRTPIGELESGARAVTAPLDLAAGLGLAKAATMVAANPRSSVTGLVTMVKKFPEKWRDFWQNIGENITTNIPKPLRAGRGTPLEFREARFQMEADIANRVEQAVDLGRNLGRDLTMAERLRADQLLRGSIVTAKTPQKLVAATAPVRKAIDEIQKELIELGRLSPETVERFQENFGPYLARLYATKEFVPPNPVIPWSKPTRAGTERLSTRGTRVEIEIPSFEQEMKTVARQLGPESEFRREFRNRARELAKRRTTTSTTAEREEVLGEQRTTDKTTSTEGAPGEFTKVPLSGVSAKLEDMVAGALTARGMTRPEAEAAIGRVKAAAVKAAQAGPEVEITGGGTTKETIKETIKQTTQRTRDTVTTVIENLGINKGQQAALHAYYDVITRAAAKAKPVTIDGRTYRVSPIMDPNSAAERVEALDPLLRAGFRVEKRTGNRVTLFRDIPEAHRRAMGEIRSEPGYVAGKGIAQAGREVAVTRFFKTVADNPEWASTTPVPGWAEMTKNKKTLGDLSGKWVRPDIAAEINDALHIRRDWEKILIGITQLWKIGKVTNPATIARNFMSSGILADWGGLSYFRPSGIRSYNSTMMGFLGRDKQGAALLAEAKKLGLFSAAYNQQEINSLATGYIQSKAENPLLRVIDGTKALVNRTGVGKIYGSVDEFYKGALYIHGRRELQYSPQLAARYAKKYAIDYSDISPFVRFMRNMPLGSPFITFASKAIPLAIETAVKHPLRFWKWPAMALGLGYLSKQTFADQEQGELRDVTELGKMRSPRFALLPGKDAEGRFRFLDLGYILPFGDVIEAYSKYMGGDKAANISFEPLGGPLQPLVELAFNKSLFTDRDILLPTDTFKEKITKVSDHLGKALLPSWAPPIPGTGFRGGYTTEAFRKAIKPDLQFWMEAPIPAADYLGRTRDLGATIASKIFGIDVKNLSIEDIFRTGEIHINLLKQELGREKGRIARMQISDEQKDALIDRLMLKYEGLEREIERTFGLDRPPVIESPAPAVRPSRGGGLTDSLGILK